jgi:DNA-binding transcriptional ArsR family regulator
LEAGTPLSVTELAKRLGVKRATVHSAIKTLRKKKLIYIADWKRWIGGRRHGGGPSRRYLLGQLPDVPMPKNNRREDWNRWRKKHKLLVRLRTKKKKGRLNVWSQATPYGM